MNAASRPETVTLPRWLWAVVGTLLIVLGGAVWESLGSRTTAMDRRLNDHDTQIKRQAEQIATIRAEMLTREQAAELLNQQRLEIKSDLGGVRDEIRGLRQELRQ